MKTSIHTLALAAVVAGIVSLAACAPAATRPDGADAVRARLTQLQSDPHRAGLAPIEMKDAEIAVSAAETPRSDDELARHLVVMADRKVEIAWATTQSRQLEEQRKLLGEQRASARLDSRTREADNARSDANSARERANSAQADASVAHSDANSARAEANAARSDANAARMDTEAARMQADELQRQVAALNARSTDRGLVVTLGDVLFASGGADLKGGAISNLNKLATFLNKYPERTVVIEGHTDSIGSADVNLALSQRRADSVKAYLVQQGVVSTRLEASGKGKGSPVASNDSATGRQQNRRVEVIISNISTAAH